MKRPTWAVVALTMTLAATTSACRSQAAAPGDASGAHGLSDAAGALAWDRCILGQTEDHGFCSGESDAVNWWAADRRCRERGARLPTRAELHASRRLPPWNEAKFSAADYWSSDVDRSCYLPDSFCAWLWNPASDHEQSVEGGHRAAARCVRDH